MTSISVPLRSVRRAIANPFVVSPLRRLTHCTSLQNRRVTLNENNLRAPTIPHHQNHPRRTRQFSSSPRSAQFDTMPKDKGNNFNLKTPKGTKDWSGSDALLRDRIFTTISNVFKRHGGTALDTPVFELREILAGKYGEDSKLIYDLKDQGGEICSLRYDLTVPFARWLAMNPDVRSIKRYHIAKVYRRDQPAVSKGRMREFYQCDFDIAGTFDAMVPDAEILRIISEVFEELGWNGRYTIKLNHRKILDGVFAVCGVPEDKLRPISSAVDKLDKMPWADVRKEMVDDKGLDGEVADRIEKYVMHKGSRELLDNLLKDEALIANASAKAGLEEMALMMDYLSAFGVLDKVSFDMSLARGLDYYTGVIYEVITEGSAGVQADAPEAQKAAKKGKTKTSEDDDRSNDPTLGVGSVAAGGRYDNLVGMFLPKAQIPCVGISFGVDRIFSITKERLRREQKTDALRSSEVDAYVMAFGGKGFNGMLKERMEICQKLWSAGIKAEFSYKLKPKLPQQFKAAEQGDVPFAIILGEEELAAGKCRIKEMGLPEGHAEKEGVEVEIASLVTELQARLAQKQHGVVSSLAQQLQGMTV
ncbi:Histidine-tRNA ligase/ATP phosphoribosyltransferase regulatory subunit [Penicillium bovifimosum]|uniref:Histidine--tRNA ligase, mitochondrial n=1 Tax=Penicillium bovifimosum TaxID=126998 RepID=A0A9W9H4C2_9EURO|nr:Histidine-tRNA ligase/ATP phosphoribosyltransferase regulatory subunit [Penicillium bovifimosum]KAJ5138427.1 Histidine-tRNA ligase/ATP phosphoribosyltransferase regulatory subunit [Penicillium bovifimosum]